MHVSVNTPREIFPGGKTLWLVIGLGVMLLQAACSNPGGYEPAGQKREADGGADKMSLEGQLAVRIAAKRDASQRVVVAMKDVTKFPWDRLFIFTPYTPKAEIERLLGRENASAIDLGIENRGDINLLVFMKDKQVAQYLQFSRRSGDFFKIKQPDGFSPDEAVFEVKEEDQGEPWLVLYPAKP